MGDIYRENQQNRVQAVQFEFEINFAFAHLILFAMERVYAENDKNAEKILACQLRWVAVKAKTQRVARYLVYTIHVLCLGIVLSFTRTQVL